MILLEDKSSPDWLRRFIGQANLPEYFWRVNEADLLFDGEVQFAPADVSWLLPHLQALKWLDTLSLDARHGEVLQSLGPLQGLREIYFSDWEVKIGLDEARELGKLRQVTAVVFDSRQNLDDAAQDYLRREMPRCEITFVEEQ